MGLLRKRFQPYQGQAISSFNLSQNIPLASDFDFVDILGRGAFRSAIFYVEAVNDSHKMWPHVIIDGVQIEPSGQCMAMDQRGWDAYFRPMAQPQYNADGKCTQYLIFEPELTFDKSLRIMVENWSAVNSINVTCYWIYHTF